MIILISAVVYFVAFVAAIGMLATQGYFNPPRRFPKGHIREYDPDGIYTYRDQNPRYNEQKFS